MMTRFLCLFALSTMAVQGGVVGSVAGGSPQSPPPQVTQPRDPSVRKPATGTGAIGGRVIDAETGAPLRRAYVNLNGSVRRTTYTDFEGRYQFANLPTGSYNVHVNPGPHRAGYQAVIYGSESVPLGVGFIPRPVELGDGQELTNVDVALPRASVIAGRVTDAFGEPVARVQVSAFLLLPGAEPRQAGGASTDDLGNYRLFNLTPGDYVVMANASMGGMQTEIEGEPIGFAPTYAPGTPVRSDAMRIRVGRGMEAAADIRLTETRVYSVSGIATTSKGEPGRGLNVMLMRPDAQGGPGFGAPVTPAGNFTIRNVPPGQYELIARWSPPRQPGTMVRGPDPDLEFVSLPIDVGSSNLDGIVLVTQPAPVITGEVVFDEPPPQFHQAMIGVQVTNRGGSVGAPRVQVKGTQFTITNAFSPVILRASFPAGPTWGLKAILLRGRDITDVPTSFTAQDSGHLQVIFTARAASLEGTVVGDDGRPTDRAAVVLFGQDPSTWQWRSSFYRTTRGLKDGAFTASGLREGSYYIAAVPLELSVSLAQPTAEFLESLSKVATAVTLNSAEKRRVDLTVLRMQQ